MYERVGIGGKLVYVHPRNISMASTGPYDNVVVVVVILGIHLNDYPHSFRL